MSDETPTVEITHVNLKIGDREISLTLEEARRVKVALDALFPVLQPPPKPYTGIRSPAQVEEDREEFDKLIPKRTYPVPSWPSLPPQPYWPNDQTAPYWSDKIWCSTTWDNNKGVVNLSC